MTTFINISDNLHSYKHSNMDFKEGEEVELFGIIQNIRTTKWGGFIILRMIKGLIQVVFENDNTIVHGLSNEMISANELSRESSIKLKGLVKNSKIKDNLVFYKSIEIYALSIEVLSVPTTDEVVDVNSIYFDNETYYTYKLDNRHITLRNPKSVAIFKISSQIVKATIDFLNSNDFTQIFTPKIVSAGAEGGANIFELEYFGKKAYLAQSPQFYKQICVGVFEKVFEIAPVFRAEKHSTSRHLNEYISIDLEMGFIRDHTDVMTLEAMLLKHVLHHLKESCLHELTMLNVELPKLPFEIPVFKLSEAHDILYQHFSDKLSKDHRNEPDMAPEEEIFICEYALKNFNSDFVFITHFPRSHRAFYSMDDPKNPELTLSFDLIMKGREITSGSQRIHKENEYREKMIDFGMNPDNFKFYLETFRNGMPPHGGLAIGLERLVAGLLNISNVKEASLFPRDINRIIP